MADFRAKESGKFSFETRSTSSSGLIHSSSSHSKIGRSINDDDEIRKVEYCHQVDDQVANYFEPIIMELKLQQEKHVEQMKRQHEQLLHRMMIFRMNIRKSMHINTTSSVVHHSDSNIPKDDDHNSEIDI